MERLAYKYNFSKEEKRETYPQKLFDFVNTGDYYCSIFNEKYCFSTFFKRIQAEDSTLFGDCVLDEYYNKPEYTRAYKDEEIEVEDNLSEALSKKRSKDYVEGSETREEGEMEETEDGDKEEGEDVGVNHSLTPATAS